ncbi:MAG: GMC family oxidoreductase [Phycisphaerales bacterium]|nr:GMC family oxidoreductase [Phycisphaerales bacterium]
MSKPLITSLSDASTTSAHRCDVCIIGAGAAGIYLANQLAAGGLDVIVLEAGGSVCGSYAEVGFQADFGCETYPGATQGRFFGVGGTTSRWGGLLCPHTSLDLRDDAEFAPDQWPGIIDTVTRHSQTILQSLGYPLDGDFSGFAERALHRITPALKGAGLQPLASLFIPFRHRNFATQLGADLSAGASLRVITDAVACDWTMREDVSDGTAIGSVAAKSPGGQTVSVSADRFVIAAGTIESTRLLLELDTQFASRITPTTAAVGCYMSDHLSCTIADTDSNDWNKAIRLLAPRFNKGWMRSMRFIETNPPPATVRSFIHLIFEHSSSGFNVVREVLGGLQRRKMPSLSLDDFVSGLTAGIGLGWGRYVQNRLHIGKGTGSRMLLDTEQIPVKDNRITLGDTRDQYDRRNPVIDWRITDQDIENMHVVGSRMLDTWNRASLDLPRQIPRELQSDTSRPYDTFHPVGTCRMGEDPEAVVSPQLQVHGTDNLWVTSTAVLPTAGTANPTFTLLCLSHELAQQMLGHHHA